jgi:hypothetical protein
MSAAQQSPENDAPCLGCLSDDLRHTCGFADPPNPFVARVIPPGLHACEGCGLELDADDLNSRCDECPIPPEVTR